MVTDKTLYDKLKTLTSQWFYNKDYVDNALEGKSDTGHTHNYSSANHQHALSDVNNLSSSLDSKVDKVNGKGLSSNDFTSTLKTKLDSIETGANKTVVDNSLSSTSSNPVENKAVNSALDGKSPVKHDSTGTNYGIGTTASYGHNKTINNLNSLSYVDGESLSAYQGKVLKDSVDNHTQNTTRVTETSSLANIGTSSNATQHSINVAINTILGNLQSLNAIEITTTLPTPSVSTLGKLYIIDEDNKVNVYYTENTGNNSNPVYNWHKMDADVLDELSVNWSDVKNKPLSFTPSNHSHGNILNDGSISSNAVSSISLTQQPVVRNSQDEKIYVSNIYNSYVQDQNNHSNIGSSANATQETINSKIDNALGNVYTKSEVNNIINEIGTGLSNYRHYIIEASNVSPRIDSTIDITVYVNDINGNPVQNETHTLNYKPPNLNPIAVGGTTDSTGKFTITSIPMNYWGLYDIWVGVEHCQIQVTGTRWRNNASSTWNVGRNENRGILVLNNWTTGQNSTSTGNWIAFGTYVQDYAPFYTKIGFNSTGSLTFRVLSNGAIEYRATNGTISQGSQMSGQIEWQIKDSSL